MKCNFRKVLKYPFIKRVSVFECLYDWSRFQYGQYCRFQYCPLNNMLSKTRYVSWCEVLLGNRTFTQLEQLKSNS